MTDKKLIPFDLERAKAGDTVCTRDGKKARIICFDAQGRWPIVCLYEGHTINNQITDYVAIYDIQGRNQPDKETSIDLFMLPKTKTYYANVSKPDYAGLIHLSNAYKTLEQAKRYFDVDNHQSTISFEISEN